jgi:hypothetical protein
MAAAIAAVMAERGRSETLFESLDLEARHLETP